MRKYTDEELIEGLIAYADEIGRTPGYREAPLGHTLSVRFGSYTNAVTVAGLTPNRGYSDVRKLRQKIRKEPKISLRFRILQRDNFRCQYCGATPQDGVQLEVDHIVARSQGGSDDPSNLKTSCWPCNQGKSNSPV